MASVAVEDNFEFAAAALSALTDKKIVLKTEYDQIQKRIRKGEDTGYVCKGKVDVVEEIKQTYAKTAAIMTGQNPELAEQEEIMPSIPEPGATFSGDTRTRNKTRSKSLKNRLSTLVNPFGSRRSMSRISTGSRSTYSRSSTSEDETDKTLSSDIISSRLSTCSIGSIQSLDNKESEQMLLDIGTSISPIDNVQNANTNDEDKYELLKQSEESQNSEELSKVPETEYALEFEVESTPLDSESKCISPEPIPDCTPSNAEQDLSKKDPPKKRTKPKIDRSLLKHHSGDSESYSSKNVTSNRQSFIIKEEEMREPVMLPFRPEETRTEGSIDLLVIQQSGKTIVVTVESENCSIGHLKEQIQLKTGFLKSEQILHFGTSLLRNDATLHEYDISSNSTIHLSLKIRGGNNNNQNLYFLDLKYLDPSFDYDFTKMTDDGTKYERGGYTYHRPYGWKRLAINVLGKYNNDDWLVNTEKSEGEWAVSYHGTNKEAFNPISEQGFKIGPRELHGKGVYSSPKIKVAQWYSSKFTYKGVEYNGILQNRVNPAGIRIPEKEHDYWICSNPKDIRPYALLVRKR